MTLRLLTIILILSVTQGYAAEKKPLTPGPQLHLTLQTKLEPATPGRQAAVQRGEIRLTASVTGLPPDNRPPLYQFALWLPTSQTPPQPYRTSGEFAADPHWSWNPDTDSSSGFYLGNGYPLTFTVTAKVGSTVLTAEAGPYKLICDECARQGFQAMTDSIITHARCLNCHASGDSPTQGDDRHLHVPAVNRQAVCSQCHGATNGTTPGSPPGTPEWGMPPFVFANKSAAELCRQIKDPARNGGRSMEQLVEHVATDRNIMWAWNPGLQRTTPTGIWNDFAQHDNYLRSFKYWVNAGAACPDEEPSSSQPSRTTSAIAPTSKTQADGCCTIAPNPAMKGRLGRLVIAYPGGAKTNNTRVDIYRAGEANAIAGNFDSYTLELLPGSYDVVISGKRVTGVTVTSAHDTKVKVGVLRVTADKKTRVDLIDPKSGQALEGGFGSREYGLPVGPVNVQISGQSETVTIQEGQITDF